MLNKTPNPKPQTLNPKPQTLNPKPQTLNPKPYTLNPNPKAKAVVRAKDLELQSLPEVCGAWLTVYSSWEFGLIEEHLIVLKP